MVFGVPQVIHFHGTPITPREQLLRMAGRHFCVSFAAPQDLKTCLSIGQSVMLDNGAFSAFTRGKQLDVKGFFKWIEPILAPPHFAIVPDAIGGSVEDQHKLLSMWPRETLGYDNACPVWHLDKPFSHLHWLINAYPKVALGSAGEYWQVGSDKWAHRMDETFNELERVHKRMPWIHGMRMLGMAGERWPLASADSTNVAQNHNRAGCAECMATDIDAVQPSGKWKTRPEQQRMFT